MAKPPLSAARAELLRRRLAQQRAESAADGPLTYSQERFWFLDQLQPGSAENHITVLVRLRGALATDALERALVELGRRHAALRACFPAQQGRARLVVRDGLQLVLERRRLAARAGAEEPGLEALCRELHARPFDLETGPLWRATLVRLARQDHALVFTMHHIVTDGWSMGVLSKDFAGLYRAFRRGEPLPPVPEAGRPERLFDLARDERRRLQGEHLAQLVEHWRARLAGAPAGVELPLDRTPPELFEPLGATRHQHLDAGTSAQLAATARELGATPYQLLLALFGAHLARLSGAANTGDLVLGSSYAGRDRPGTQGLVSALVNTLALRLQPDLTGNLGSLVEACREVLREATQHAELPFEKLVQELAPARDPRSTPLFNVFFDLVVAHEMPDWDGLEASEQRPDLGAAPFDLALAVDLGGERYRLAWQYRTSLFDGTTIDALHASFSTFINAVLEDPSAPLLAAPLVEPALAARLALPTASPGKGGGFEPVGATFATAARRHGARTALVDDGQRWTYAGLERATAGLACALHARLGGPGPG
ncbi:MAG: condensation domain-containing protein, partial [Planctomycetota bacterium]|nr:condensation domain-containing protein [Planctomycetota bacterium]